MVRKALLVCGILSSLLYVATDIVAAMRYEGYSYTSQTISELSAIGAPTRAFLGPVYFAYEVLLIAFGLGVWVSAGRKRALRVTGGLMVAHGVVNMAVGPFSSMHMRETVAMGGATLSDTLHIALASVTVLLILLTIGFGATAFGKRFRLYSIVTIVILVVFGALTGLEGLKVAANLPTPWIGVTERINVYGYMLWVVVLATALLRVQGKKMGPSQSASFSGPKRFIRQERPHGARHVSVPGEEALKVKGPVGLLHVEGDGAGRSGVSAASEECVFVGENVEKGSDRKENWSD